MGEAGFEITLRREVNLSEDYQPNQRHTAVVTNGSGDQQTESIERDEFGELKSYLDEQQDFDRQSLEAIRILTTVAGVAITGIGVLFCLTLAGLFVGIPLGGGGLLMIQWGMTRELTYEYTGDNVMSVREELREQFQ